MKQGSGKSSDSGRKVEPKSKAVGIAYVSELGIHQVRTRSAPMYEGRGYEAPKTVGSNHPRGSQGKH